MRRSQAQDMVEALGYQCLEITTHNDARPRYLVHDRVVSEREFKAACRVQSLLDRPKPPTRLTFWQSLVQYLKECW